MSRGQTFKYIVKSNENFVVTKIIVIVVIIFKKALLI